MLKKGGKEGKTLGKSLENFERILGAKATTRTGNLDGPGEEYSTSV